MIYRYLSNLCFNLNCDDFDSTKFEKNSQIGYVDHIIIKHFKIMTRSTRYSRFVPL
jgi:hypothetical protein